MLWHSLQDTKNHLARGEQEGVVKVKENFRIKRAAAVSDVHTVTWTYVVLGGSNQKIFSRSMLLLYVVCV